MVRNPEKELSLSRQDIPAGQAGGAILAGGLLGGDIQAASPALGIFMGGNAMVARALLK
jgi:hypothetical protein